MNNIIEAMIYKAVQQSTGFEYLLYANYWIHLHIALSFLELLEYETN